MLDFYRTHAGKKFFEADLPRMISAMERLADAAERLADAKDKENPEPRATGQMIDMSERIQHKPKG